MERLPPTARWFLWAAGIVLTGVVLYQLKPVLTPVLVAFLLAYILNPAVAGLERWRIPRTAGIVILLAAALLALTLFILLVLPSIVRDVAALLHELPTALGRIYGIAEPWLRERGVELPGSAGELMARFKGGMPSLPTGAVSTVGAVVSAALGGTVSFLNAVAAGVLVPVFAFYLLKDFDPIVAGIRELLPARIRSLTEEVMGEVDEVLGQFIRGQLTVMVILAVLYAVSYSLIGVRLAVPIGVVAGLLSFIPYVGGAVALGLALLMTALHWTGWVQLALVVVAYAVIQVLEGFVITPRIVGEKLGLSPVWVLFGLMVGGHLFGFMGVMLALPATAVGKVLVVRGVDTYKRSAVYRGDDAGGEGGAGATPPAGSDTGEPAGPEPGSGEKPEPDRPDK